MKQKDGKHLLIITLDKLSPIFLANNFTNKIIVNANLQKNTNKASNYNAPQISDQWLK